jgi:hypothetical protein
VLVRLPAFVLVVGLLSLSGCGPAKVASDINASLSPSEPEKLYQIPKVSSERTIHVEATSSTAEIDVYVITDTDIDKFLADAHDARPKKSVASKQKDKSVSLDATIPANTEATVVVYLSDKASKREKTQVTGKISSK